MQSEVVQGKLEAIACSYVGNAEPSSTFDTRGIQLFFGLILETLLAQTSL